MVCACKCARSLARRLVVQQQTHGDEAMSHASSTCVVQRAWPHMRPPASATMPVRGDGCNAACNAVTRTSRTPHCMSTQHPRGAAANHDRHRTMHCRNHVMGQSRPHQHCACDRPAPGRHGSGIACGGTNRSHAVRVVPVGCGNTVSRAGAIGSHGTPHNCVVCASAT